MSSSFRTQLVQKTSKFLAWPAKMDKTWERTLSGFNWFPGRPSQQSAGAAH
jgi:hypothetical protein